MFFMEGTGKLAPVAQLPQNFYLLSNDESKPQYNNINGNHLLLLSDKSKQKTARLNELDLLSRYEKILTSKICLDIYKYLLKVGCACGPEIMDQVRISEASTYRVLNRLKKYKFVSNVYTLRRKGVNGKRPLIYGVDGYTKDELDKAITRCMKQTTPIYDYVDNLVQQTLHDVKNEEIQFSKIVYIARAYGNKGFHYMDLADEMAKVMHFKGVKVIK